MYRDPLHQSLATPTRDAEHAMETEPGADIDLDRLVWDQEYRDEVRGQLRAA